MIKFNKSKLYADRILEKYMKILNCKRYIFLKAVISFMLMVFSMSSFAKSYLTFDEFKSLPKQDQLSVLNKVQSVIATIEKKQSIHLRRAEAEKHFKNNKTYSYEKQILKLWSLVIAKAYAGDDFSFKGISGDELCLFGGWPSYKTYSPSLKYNVCVHPDRISEISGLSPEKKALGEAYDQFKSKFGCASSHGILCNPALYGELDYCAPGKDIITAQDSSIACWVESKKQDKDEELLASITANGELSEEFHGLLKLVFGMCLCQGKYVDTDGKRKRVITEFYSNYAMGHRTCAGLLSQVRKVTNNLKLAGTCSALTSSSINNVARFINNINSKVDDYLNNEMFTGNGASQAYYENYSPLGFNRTAVERAKNQLRKNATLEDDQYCNGTLYTEDEEQKIPPVVIINRDDKGDTYHITITIDFSNSTYNMNEFKLEVTTEPNVQAVSITNNVYVFNKISTDITVNIKYTHTQTNLEIHNSSVIIPGKNTATDKVDLKVTEVEDKEEHIRYEYQVIYKGEDITNKTDKYELEITSPTGADLETLMTSLQNIEYTNQFTKIDSAYDVKFHVKHKASNTEDNELVSIKIKEDEVIGFKIAIEETKPFDDDKYYLNAYVKEGDKRLDEIPEGHEIKWYLKNSINILHEEAAIEVLRKQDTLYVVAKLIGTDNLPVDSAEKEIVGKNSNTDIDKYTIEIAEDKTKTEDNKTELTAVVFENKDGTKEELTSIPDDHTVQWYKEGSKVDGANALTNNFERTETTYAVEIKLLDASENEVSKANANIDKKDSSDTDNESISISITKNELVEETYKLEATITYKSEETTEIPEGYSVKWTITSETTDDDSGDDDLLDALDGDVDTTVTKTGTLTIDVAQGKLTKVAKVEVLKDDKSKSSDSATLDGTGIDIDEKDDNDRSIGSNNNPYQQKMSPPMNVPRPKMILRGKDGHQGRWGY